MIGRLQRTLLDVWCGEDVRYEDALDWQHRLVEARLVGSVPDLVLTLAHDPVYTAGRRADVEHNVLGTRPIRVVRADRGGDVTYHGPGQLVAYPITLLPHAKAVRAHVDALERACVQTAAAWGIRATTRPDRPGIWVGDDKLAAIGVRVDRGVTLHGLAFNVAPRMDDFDGLIACGLPDAGVCSLESLGVDAGLGEVRDVLVERLAEGFGASLLHAPPSALGLGNAPGEQGRGSAQPTPA